MQSHYMLSECDGGLYDTRADGWHDRAPLRARYAYHHSRIDSAAAFKATLRAGAYSFPGCYPVFLAMADATAVCFECARIQARDIFTALHDAKRGRFYDPAWRPVACSINYEDSELHCDCCNARIESACGESE